MTVTVLPTTYGLTNEAARSYPDTITVELPPKVEVAAYGAADNVWLGLPNWTGDAGVGADGSESVRLFPAGHDGKTGPRIIYESETGCAGCKVADAAPYFREAMREYNRTENFDGRDPLPIPRGLTVRRVSKTYATYSLPSENTLHTRGAVSWDGTSVRPFQQIRLTLPDADRITGEFLLKYFATHVVQRFRH